MDDYDITGLPGNEVPEEEVLPEADPYAAYTPEVITGGLTVANSGNPIMDAYLTAQQGVATQLQSNIDLYRKGLARLQARSAGPSRRERLLTLAAALGKPTRTGSFGEQLGNFTEALAGTEGARRKAQEERDLLAEQYGLKIGNEQLKLAQSGAATAAQLLRSYTNGSKGKPIGQPYERGNKRVVAVQNADGTITEQVVGDVGEVKKKPLAKATLNGQPLFVDDKGQMYDTNGNPVNKADNPPKALTPVEQRQLIETEDAMNSIADAIRATQQAIQLNKTAYAGSLAGISKTINQLFADNNSQGYKDTEKLANLLKGLALSKLKSTFPGAISNDERKALEELEGAANLSAPAREEVFKQKMPVLIRLLKRHENRIGKIKGRYYSTSTPQNSAPSNSSNRTSSEWGQ